MATGGLRDHVHGMAIGDFIRQQREQAEVSVRGLARLAGVSNPYLSQIERGLRRPSAEVLQQLAKALRISAEQLYVHAGFLDPRPAGGDVINAILADDSLSEPSKLELIAAYQSRRRAPARDEHFASVPPDSPEEPT
jgi:transcriptional regulator with XRE-family HTH domain